MADDLAQMISDAAEAPQEVDTDGLVVIGRPLSELIKADQYLRGKEAAAKKTSGVRFAKLVPPGTVNVIPGTQ